MRICPDLFLDSMIIWRVMRFCAFAVLENCNSHQAKDKSRCWRAKWVGYPLCSLLFLFTLLHKKLTYYGTWFQLVLATVICIEDLRERGQWNEDIHSPAVGHVPWANGTSFKMASSTTLSLSVLTASLLILSGLAA